MRRLALEYHDKLVDLDGALVVNMSIYALFVWRSKMDPILHPLKNIASPLIRMKRTTIHLVPPVSISKNWNEKVDN